MAFPPPQTGNVDAVVHYAYSIVVNGKEIGVIQRFSPSSTRTAERLREIRASTGTRTVALVPGREDRELTLERVTLFRKSLITYFSEGDTPSPEVFFANIRSGFDIVEHMFEPVAVGSPDEAPSTVLRTITYKNCVPNNWSKSIDLGAVFVNETVSVTCGDVV